MPIKYTYLIIDLGAIIVPFIFSFHRKIKFSSHFKPFIASNLIVSAAFIIWDILFTKSGVWNFNNNYVLGFYIVNLPVEEVLFFICIPFSSVFTYHCFKLFFNAEKFISRKTISIVLIVLMITLTFFQFHKQYTATCCTLLACLLLIIDFGLKSKWLNNFYLMYLAILLPFFIVNGILTGTGLDEPIVSYNNEENIGFRLLTIPIEDVFYGMLLLLANTLFYELFSKAKQ